MFPVLTNPMVGDAAMMKNPHEERLTALLRKAAGKFANGEIICDLDSDGVGYTCDIRTGLLGTECFDQDDLPKDFSDLLQSTYAWSRIDPRGPAYRMTIELSRLGGEQYRYWWEEDGKRSLSGIVRTISGSMPSFVLRHRFDRELIDVVDDSKILELFLFHVPARFARNELVPASMFELYAVVDWEADTSNGTFDQYFARPTDISGLFAREALYPATLRGLERLGMTDAIALYREAIALYSHFNGRVEQARERIGISAVPRQEESDIMHRYYRDFEEHYRTALADYVRSASPQVWI
jgi:hypothetical protein